MSLFLNLLTNRKYIDYSKTIQAPQGGVGTFVNKIHVVFVWHSVFQTSLEQLIACN